MVIRAHSDALLLVHIVFATVDRRAILPPAFDDWRASQLISIALRHGGELLASGNADDHVHVVASIDPAIAVAQFVQRLKGASAYEWNRRHPLNRLRWQAGYWAESIARGDLGRLLDYVKDQRGREQNVATAPDERL